MEESVKGKRIIILGCIVLMLAGCGSTDKKSYYEQGAAYLEASGYEDAIGSFELSIAEGENVAESYRGEGIAYLRLQNYDEAIQAFGKALSSMEKKDAVLKRDIQFYLATALYQSGDLSSALGICDQILETDGNKEAYFLRGKVHLEMNSYEEASADFKKVLADSEDFNDFINVYLIYQENDMRADGEAYLEEALSIPVNDEEGYYQRGRVQYYLENYEDAREDFIEAMNNEHKDAAFYLGKVYIAMEDISSARAIYQEYLESTGKSARAYDGLAYCDIMEGNYESALEYIQKGLALEDSDETKSLLFNEIVIYERLRDFETAKEKVTAYLEQFPLDEAAIKEKQFLQRR